MRDTTIVLWPFPSSPRSCSFLFPLSLSFPSHPLPPFFSHFSFIPSLTLPPSFFLSLPLCLSVLIFGEDMSPIDHFKLFHVSLFFPQHMPRPCSLFLSGWGQRQARHWQSQEGIDTPCSLRASRQEGLQPPRFSVLTLKSLK